MKLKYEKPVVAVDRYELTQSIASCGIKVNSTGSDCFQDDPDTPPHMRSMAVANVWFADDSCGNQVIAGVNDENGYCYHTQANSVLTS